MKWNSVELKQLCFKIGSGSTPRGGDSVYITSGAALIRSQNVYNNSFTRDGLVFIDDKTADKMKGVAVESNDVLLNITGDSVARCAMVEESILPARVNQHVAIIRTNKEILDPKFLQSFLVTPLMQAKMLSWAGNGGTRKALTKGMIEEFKIPVPPLPIQQKIADILSAYDALIENNRRRIQLLEKSARLLYQEWFVHLRFPGHEHVKVVDGVPEGWENTCLPDVIDVNPTTKVEKGKAIKYVPMTSLSESNMEADSNSFEIREKHTAVKFKRNDTLLARITPCLENGKTGYAYFLTEDEVACGSTEFIVLRGKRVSSEFVYCLARSYPFRELAIKSMTGSSGRQRVQKECFDEYKVPLAPESILREFSENTGVLFRQIQSLQVQNQKLAQVRDILLPRLMNGEVEV